METTNPCENVVDTPSNVMISRTTNSELKQSCLLFPTTSTSAVKDTPTSRSVPSDSCNGTVSDVSPPQVVPAGNLTQADVHTQMEAHGVDKDHKTDSCHALKNLSTAVTTTAKTRVRHTKEEMEALRLQREKLKAETLALKEEEKLKREESKLKKELEKKARRELREREEKARQEKKEARERERIEKLAKKKMEEQRKREEKKKFELMKQLSAEEKIRKQQKEQDMFAGFFSKRPKSELNVQNDMPKEAKHGRFDTAVFDETIQNQALSGSFLVECRGRKLQNNNQSDRMECDDVIIMSSPTAPPKPRMKLLQFHTNIRPAYYGSWRKKSKIISGRRPIKMDTSVLDYEVDSDDEWEEEEEGESVSSASEGEEDSGAESGEEGDDDGFFVPHGYLSEDEGERSESEEGPVGAEMDKVKAKAKAWEAEFQRTCQPKKVVCIGCVWVGGREKAGEEEGEGEEEEGGWKEKEREEEKSFLSQFSALVLTDKAPVQVEPPITAYHLDNQGTSTTDAQKRPVPEEAMSDLIRLVHHNTSGLAKLIKSFQLHWGAVLLNRGWGTTGLSPREPLPSVDGGTSLQGVAVKEGECENASRISKRQLEKKIQQIAVKEVRAPSTKNTWYVHDSILQQYKIDPAHFTPLVLPPTPKSSRNSTEKSTSPETPLATPVAKKGSCNKRKLPGGTPSVKTLFEAIAKSPQNSSAVATPPNQKRLKLTPLSSTSGGGRGACADGTRGEPPKKRICLETLCSKSPAVNATGTRPQTDSPVPPSVNTDDVIEIGDSLSSDSGTLLQSTHHLPDTSTVSNTAESVLASSHSVPPAIQSSSQPRLPLVSGTMTQVGEKTVAESKSTKCLRELTNQNSVEVDVDGGGKGGGDGKEVKHYIDWQKLNSTMTSDPNKVTVIAEIH